MADRGTRRIALVAAAVALLTLAPGCYAIKNIKNRVSTWRPFTSSYDDPLANEKLAKAHELYNTGQYSKAYKIFKELADNQGNSNSLAEEARWMQAESRRVRGQFPEAVDVYHRYLMDFINGAHKDQAIYWIYQIGTYWLEDFKTELAARQNESGILHWRPSWPHPGDITRPTIVQESRAIEALEYVTTYDVRGPLADKALYWCGYVRFIRGNFEEADHYFQMLINMHPQSPLRPQAYTFAIQAKNASTGGAVYDGNKCAQASHLIQVAEASIPEMTRDPQLAEMLAKSKFAIRYQQAEKDFLTAEYYERTGHPGSAVFYYTLTERRYANTRYAQIARERMARIRKRMDAGDIPTSNDPLAIAQKKWKGMFAKKKPPGNDDEEEDALGIGNFVPLGMGGFGGSSGGMGGMGGLGGMMGGPAMNGGYQR
ncbi:MAG TPA: tetratricopeptide repeat protein [Urbifossiella sp.]|nr:tetratricopeptide repeat protein [Urbifossiella sp.]